MYKLLLCLVLHSEWEGLFHGTLLEMVGRVCWVILSRRTSSPSTDSVFHSALLEMVGSTSLIKSALLEILEPIGSITPDGRGFGEPGFTGNSGVSPPTVC